MYFWKLEFNRYMMFFFNFEKVLRVHVQRKLEIIRCLYTGVDFKQNFEKKSIKN